MPAKPPFDKVPTEHLMQWVRDSTAHPLGMPVSALTIYGYAQHTPGARNYDVFGELIFLAGKHTNVRVASFAEAADWWQRLGYGVLTRALWADYISDVIGTTTPGRWRQKCIDWFGIDPEELN